MADVLIRGMEMPPNCISCEFYREIPDEDDTILYCIAAKKDINPHTHICPLVPLPEGHGRLIDADALIREGADISDGYWVGEYCEATEWGYSTKMIENAHTIVPAEGGGEE